MNAANTAADALEARHLIIRGRVQGVGFRWSMTQAAQALQATGWVRNRPDGTVEALIIGNAGQIAALLNWARQGPPAARVDGVAVELAHVEHLADFYQR